MEYYSIKDAISEGVMVKTRLKCDLNSSHMQEFLKGRIVDNEYVYLPYYLIDCIINTDYLEIVEVIDKKRAEEMEGSPNYIDMQEQLLYSAVGKIETVYPLPKEEKEIIKYMHLSRAVKGSLELAEPSIGMGYEKEEESILRKGKIGWTGEKSIF